MRALKRVMAGALLVGLGATAGFLAALLRTRSFPTDQGSEYTWTGPMTTP